MSAKISGVYRSGVLTIPAGQTATWTHNAAAPALKVELLNAEGLTGPIANVTVDQVDANTVTVLNADAANIVVSVWLTFAVDSTEDGGVAGAAEIVIA